VNSEFPDVNLLRNGLAQCVCREHDSEL